MKNLFDTTLKTVVALFAILILSNQNALATGKVATQAKPVDGVVTVYATLKDDYYVAVGEFNREYHQQLLKQLSDPKLLSAEFSKTLEMTGVDNEALAVNYTDSIARFSQASARNIMAK